MGNISTIPTLLTMNYNQNPLIIEIRISNVPKTRDTNKNLIYQIN